MKGYIIIERFLDGTINVADESVFFDMNEAIKEMEEHRALCFGSTILLKEELARFVVIPVEIPENDQY